MMNAYARQNPLIGYTPKSHLEQSNAAWLVGS